MHNPPNNDSLTHFYEPVNVSRSFYDFINERTLDYTNDVFFYIGKQYIVFQNIKPLLSRFQEIVEALSHKHVLDLKTFYRLSKEARIIQNLLTAFFWKAKTGTVIKALNKERTHLYEILAIYRERYLFDIDFDEEQFDYLLTITYPHPIITKNLIFIMAFNLEITRKTNRGFQRARVYFFKFFKDRLKNRIKDPTELNREARKLTDRFFRYIKFYETHANGFIHVHVLISFPKEFMKRDFKEIIKLIAGWFETSPLGIDLKYIPKKDRRKAKKYVKKVLMKRYRKSSLKYTVDNDNELYYLINLEAFFLNDISFRIISHSRNVEIIKRKRTQIRKVRELTNKKEDRILKKKDSRIIEIERIQLEIDFVSYELVRRDVERFKELKKRKEERRSLREEERERLIDTLKRFVRDEIISKDELKAVIYTLDRLNEEIKSLKQYLELITQAQKKINQMLFETIPLHGRPPDFTIEEEDDDIDWVDF